MNLVPRAQLVSSNWRLKLSRTLRLAPLCRYMAATFLAAACTADAEGDSRERVARALAESLGEAADPEIAFRRDSSHLLIQLATIAFPTVLEDELTRRARGIANTALSTYDKADQLDSITVLYREKAGNGIAWIRNTRTFSVDSLNILER